MLDSAYHFLASLKDKKKEYGMEILNLSHINKERIAFHGFCTDGIVSASILHHLKFGQIFIPIDYWILRQPVLRNYLSSLNWKAIVDLEPFNSNRIDLYVDHHISSLSYNINSTCIHFELNSGGLSAASVLLNSGTFHGKIPSFLKELVRISEITDTASYPISPPIESIKMDTLESTLGQKVWFLEDACNSLFTASQNIELIERLSENGIKGLFNSKIIHRVNYYRRKRKEYVKYSGNIPTTDCLIIINPPNKIAKDTLIHTLLSNTDVKILVILFETQTGVRLSLRRSKKLEIENEKLANRIRLDLLAQSMQGGGHPAASGARSDNIDIALETITSWVENLGFSVKIVNSRDYFPKFRHPN